MKVLVVGGFGFVGKQVVEQLLSTSHSVVALSRRNGLDMTSYDSCFKNFKEQMPDVIINLAAHVGSLHYVTQKAADVVDDNLQIMINLYRAVKDACPDAKIINPISNCSYPGDANIHKESEWWNGSVHKSVLSYANPKRMLAVISECYEMQHNIKSINFFVPNAYGPGDYADPNRTHALNGMIIRMLKAKEENLAEFEIWGTGNPTREWIFVKDFAKMLVNAVEMPQSQISPVNIAQNKAHSIRETAEMIKQITGYQGKLVFNSSYQDGAPTKQLDDALFKSKFPNFSFTDISQGIKETVDYYKNVFGGSKMRVLVTGGAGFVGTALVPLLLEKKLKVRVVDCLLFGGTQLLPFFANPDFEFIKGDIRNKELMAGALKDVDAIIHLAGIVGYPACRKNPQMAREVNIEGTRILAELSGNKIPFIFASTGSTYGKLIADLCTETTPLNPLTNYGEHKKEAEEILQKRGNCVIYRFATGYGVSPRLRLDVLPNDFTYKALKEKTLIIYEKNFMRTFIHVRDMARAFVFALDNFEKMKNEVYNVGDESQNLSKEQVALMIKNHVKDVYIHFADVGKDFDQRDYVVSYEKIRKAGFKISVSMEDAIKEMIKAFEVIEINNPFTAV